MLQELDIRNYALIEKVKIDFSPGLNILTGETGAGKSIIIGAMGLILGDRASSDAIRTGSEIASVRATIDISSSRQVNVILSETSLQNEDDDSSVFISREISQSGRTRCWVNEHSTNVSLLKDIGDYLIDIHGQHEHQTLFRKEKHLQMLDEFGGLRSLCEQIVEFYIKLQELQSEYENLVHDRDEKIRQKDFLEFQMKELEDSKLDEDEEERLLQERQILNNAELIFELAGNIYERLYGGERSNFVPILDILKSIRTDITRLHQIDAKMEETRSRFENSIYDIEDIARQVLDYRDSIDFDPKRLSLIEARLDVLYRLKRKYLTDSVKGLILYRQDIAKQLEDISLSSARMDEIHQQIQKLRIEASEAAFELSKQRQYYARKMKELVEKELGDLGMEKTVFEVHLAQDELKDTENGQTYIENNGKKLRLSINGIDSVEFLISPNIGEELKPLTKIASGGEISRIMLALKTVLALGSDHISPSTMIFDEIDTGIGGRIAEVIGRKLKQLAVSRQVICITHLPQIASLADSHNRVQKKTIKNRTIVEVQRLDAEERVKEIARMLAGERITDVTIAHAREMIEQAREG